MAKLATTRTDLCNAVYHEVGLPRGASAALVELVLKEITDCLVRGETVQLSSFGSFVVRKKVQGIGRNPKNGKEVPISSRRVIVFKPSAMLKRHINSAIYGTVSARASLGVAPMPGTPDFMSPIKRAAARQRSAAKSRAVKTARSR